MTDRQKRNIDWTVAHENGVVYENAGDWSPYVTIAVLMDIRQELRKLNAHCSNFTEIPTILRGIRQRLPKKRKPAKKGTHAAHARPSS